MGWVTPSLDSDHGDGMSGGPHPRWRVYGITWGSSRMAMHTWKQMNPMDIIRAASRGNPGRMPRHTPDRCGCSSRVESINHATKVGSPQWKISVFAGYDQLHVRHEWYALSALSDPSFDGPFSGAFGAYSIDRSRTPRSEMVEQNRRNQPLTPNPDQTMAIPPVKGDI